MPSAPRIRPAEPSRIAGRADVILGASSGFGRGFAVRLGRRHARVVLAVRRAELLEEVAAQVLACGREALGAATDGAARRPTEAGRGVDDGLRARMKAEDAARNAKR